MVKNLKRTLALMLSIIMILSSTMTAFASDEGIVTSNEAETSAQIEETVAAEEEPSTEAPKAETATEAEQKEEAAPAQKAPEKPQAFDVELKDVAAYFGEDATFAIKTDGEVRSCQWQMSKDNGKRWSNLSKRQYGSSESLVIKADQKNNGRMFRCEVTFKNGAKALSDAARLKAEKAPTFPAISFEPQKVGNVTVKVDAPEGALPAGATMDVAEVGLDDVQDVVDTTKSVEGKVVAAVDITFFDANGKEIEPNAPVKVEMISKEIAEVENPTVVHVDAKADNIAEADVEAEEVKSTIATEGVEFSSDKFSIYAVIGEGEEGQYARMTINFYNNHLSGEKKVATVYVKNGDNEEMIDKIVYDPGINEILPSHYLFRGWTIDAADANAGEGAGTNYGPDYDLNTKVYDINGIKEYILGLASKNKIKEGDELNIYAIILQTYSVTYVEYVQEEGEEEATEVTLGSHSIPVALNNGSTPAEVEYTLNYAYTPAADENFEGWKVVEGIDKIVSPTVTEDTVIPNKTNIVINGNIKVTPVTPKGAWLVFNENGKGATYTSPRFVKHGEVTERPRPDSQMTRNGYTFGGWYKLKDGAELPEYDEKHASYEITEDRFEAFTFGEELTEKTTLYAKWNPRQSAPYTVVFWEQNNARNGYNIKASYTGEGTVGQNIPFTFRNNGDEDYVTVGGSDYHYAGFCLNHSETDQLGTLQKTTGYGAQDNPIKEDVEVPKITAEGDAVLNIYFDRIKYNLRFYLYRMNGNNAQNAHYPRNNGTNTWGMVNGWNTGRPTTTYTLNHENVDGYDSYYFTITAYYGDDIGNIWPSYDEIDGPGNYQVVSYILMQGAKLRPDGISVQSGKGTVKGKITAMDEMILGQTNNANGNFLICRFDDTVNYWTYHIYFEAYEGQDLSGKTTRTLNGKTYYLDHDDPSRSSNRDAAQQNGAQYQGFTPVMQADGVTTYYDNVQGTNTNSPSLNYYYDRESFVITYNDGVYLGGNELQNILAEHQDDAAWHTSDPIQFGANIPEDQLYTPPVPNPKENGFVFAGWFADAAGKVPYTFDTMPYGGIIVYAKWVQSQYRVFLHPNATMPEDGSNDPTLNWGSPNQQMNFRISYGKYVSTPTGLRDQYEFVGWFTDDGTFQDYFDGSVIPMSDDITDPSYDKTKDMTDPMNIWGDIGSNPYNSDITGWDDDGVESTPGKDRFWVTRKLDLYGKWKAITVGAKGIKVEYDANGGTGTPVDDAIYEDNSRAYAQAATTPPAVGEGEKELKFKHWRVMKWDNDSEQYVDSGQIVLPGDDFLVLQIDAKITDNDHGDAIIKPEDVDKDGHYTYTVLLKAEYDAIDEPEPTHIDWVANKVDVTGAPITVALTKKPANAINQTTATSARPFTGWYVEDKATGDLQINEAIDIRPADTYEYLGYTFLGWAKKPDATAEDLFLKYENGKFYAEKVEGDGAWTEEVTQVAADEYQPYDDLYAIWQGEFYVYHSGVPGGNIETIPLTTATYDLTNTPEGLTANTLYGGYYLKGGFEAPSAEDGVPTTNCAAYDGENWTWNTAQTVNAKEMTPVSGTTYYIKEVPTCYLQPYTHYTYNTADKKIRNMWFISSVDDKHYQETGFLIETDHNRANVTSSLTVTNATGGKQVTMTASSIFGSRGVKSIGYLSFWEFTGIGANVNVAFVPYWITPDGIKVYGITQRSIAFNNGKIGSGGMKITNTAYPPTE